MRILLNDFRMTSTVDEEIIRKRLLLDGEGAGDDRKLTMILKSFLKVILIPDNLTGNTWPSYRTGGQSGYFSKMYR